MVDGNGPRYKAPAIIQGVPPEANRALVAAFRDLEAILAGRNSDVVDRRQKTSVRVQPNQILRASNGTAVLPHPAPARAQRCTVVVEAPPVRLSAEGKALINGVPELVVSSVGALEAVSTGEAWWIVGNGVLLTAQSSDLPAGATGPRGASGEPGIAGQNSPPGVDGRDAEDGIIIQIVTNDAPRGAGAPYLRGDDGSDGECGPPGTVGQVGPRGDIGPPGDIGPIGEQGDIGPQGPVGSSGADGQSGPAGIGVPGSDGADGETTIVLGGQSPSAGAATLQVILGADGADGDSVFAPGPSGAAGSVGATGPTGPAGSAGAGLISSVDVNLGTVPLWSGTFDITGLSGLTIGDAVLVTRGIDPTIPDEAQESVGAAGVVISATTIRVQWEGIGGPMAGTRRFYYAQLTGNQGDDFTAVQRADSDVDNASALLTVLPQFNWSRSRAAISHEFEGCTARGILGAMRPFGQAKIYKLASEAAHPGSLRLVVPLGTSGGLCMGDLPTEAIWNPATLLGFRCIVRLVTANPASDYDVSIGLGDDISNTGASLNLGANSLSFFTSATVPSWRRVRRAAGVETGINGAATLLAGNWYVLEYMNTAGTWEGFVNGASVGSGATNVPTALMNFGLLVQDDGGGTTDFVVDIDGMVVFTDTLGQRFT